MYDTKGQPRRRTRGRPSARRLLGGYLCCPRTVSIYPDALSEEKYVEMTYCRIDHGAARPLPHERRGRAVPTPLRALRTLPGPRTAQGEPDSKHGRTRIEKRNQTTKLQVKLLAKLADNIFHSTKPYRCPDAARLARQCCLLLTTILPRSGRFIARQPKAKARGSPITTLRTTPGHGNCPSDA